MLPGESTAIINQFIRVEHRCLMSRIVIIEEPLDCTRVIVVEGKYTVHHYFDVTLRNVRAQWSVRSGSVLQDAPTTEIARNEIL